MRTATATYTYSPLLDRARRVVAAWGKSLTRPDAPKRQARLARAMAGTPGLGAIVRLLLDRRFADAGRLAKTLDAA